MDFSNIAILAGTGRGIHTVCTRKCLSVREQSSFLVLKVPFSSFVGDDTSVCAGLGAAEVEP